MCEKLCVRSFGETRIISIEDISYFDVVDKKLTVYYGKEKFSFPGSIKAVEEEFGGKGFCRVHRCYVISLDHIEKVVGRHVVLDTPEKTRIPVGRSYAERFYEAIAERNMIFL